MHRLATVVVLLVLGALPAGAGAASLYTGPGSRPGPDLLYAKAPFSPQLTNARPWRAKPILVSGTTSYRRGEFVYQDFLYDDAGARYNLDPFDPRKIANAPDPGDERVGDLFSRPNGTYTYPTADGYADNAADLLELRVKPLRRATAFRLALNTLKDPSLVAFTIAIGGKKEEPRAFPFGANVQAPADLFLTVHADGKRMVGELAEAATGKRVGGLLRARVDRRRRHIEVRVPRRAWNPRRRKVRLAAGVGLWDAAGKAYLLPGESATETTPGGAGSASDPAGFFNVAFRMAEPFPKPTENDRAVLDPAWWRDRLQGNALTAGDISQFFVEVDFRKLARRVRDDSAVPTTGPMNRILTSSFEVAQGADFSRHCLTSQSECPGVFQGRLQPYGIYVPAKPRPKRGYGLTLLLHSLGANYNQYASWRHQAQFGERGGGSIVITPEARGPDGFYQSYAAADVFDVWADVARRFKLDPGWTVISGYSMGGVGAFTLGAQFPDLFARAQPTVGEESEYAVLASLRNVPVLMWNNHGDELVNNALFMETANALDELGYRYELDAFQPCANPACSALFPNHLQLAINDWYAPAAEFLGTARVDRNPAHVTYVVEPGRNHPELGVAGDHAYWVSRLKLRDGADQGKIDAFSHGFGVGHPEAGATEHGTGTLEGGNFGTLTYMSQGRKWGPVPKAPRANRIDVVAEGIAAATIDVKRARVGCDAEVKIVSDGPLQVTLRGCRGRTVTG